jgi:hypothetical protein
VYLYKTMRRLAAFILLFPLGILFTGAVNLAAVCPVSQQDICANTPDQCCHKDGTCHKTQAACRKDQKSGLPNSRKPEHSACCFDCPLCALITVPSFIRFEPTRTEITTEYAVKPDNLLTDYYQHHWKPPDIAHLS